MQPLALHLEMMGWWEFFLSELKTGALSRQKQWD